VLPRCGAPGFDYVAIARTETVSRNFAELVADMTMAMERLNAKAGAATAGAA
jgi:hypothetical protein